MRIWILLCSLAALAGCATTEQLPNGCVVDALSHRYAVSSHQQLTGKTEFNEVLVVEFTDQKVGHALSIFAHKGEMWAYDYERGSWKIAYHLQLSAEDVAGLIYAEWRIKRARFL